MKIRLQSLFIIYTLFALIVVACTPQDEPLPTLVPTIPLDEPTATLEEPTEEPAIEEAPTQAPPAGRATLPPTWTPLPQPTDIPTPTPLIPTITPFIPPDNILPAACDAFDIDYDNTDIEFREGVSPRVSWFPVQGAIRYRVIVANASGLVIRDDIYLAETTYQFSADLFQFGQFYGWTVYPINTANDQMCNFVGAQLIPIRPLGG